MIYQNSQLSKLATILWLVALSHSAIDSCATTIAHPGDVYYFDVSGVNTDCSYTCDATYFTTLGYCTVDVCQDCQALIDIYSIMDGDSTTQSTKTYTQSSLGTLYGNSQNCNITDEEFNYRTYIEDATMDKLSDNQSVYSDTLPDCCMVECDDKFTFTSQVCAFDGSTSLGIYSDMSVFCVDFCNNRTITVLNCGDTGCGVDQGCAYTQTTCLSSFNGNPPVCGSDYVLYATADDYCTAKINGTVTTYKTKYCDPVCTDADCSAQECEYSELATYTGNVICDNNGDFYYDLETYCEARAAGIAASYILCDGAPCEDLNSCCVNYCKQENASYQPGCGSDYTYYSTVDDFCTAKCATPITVLTQHLCQDEGCQTDCDRECTVNECASLNCQANEQLYDVCSIVDYTVITNQAYCDENYNDTPLVYSQSDLQGCTDSSSAQIDCVSSDCDYKKCIFDQTNYQGTQVCAKNSAGDLHLYTDDDTFCVAKGSDETWASFACEADCTSDTDCCYSNCLTVTTDYVPTCSEGYVHYALVEDYCTATCNSVAILQCNGANCDQQQCWYDECFASPYMLGCDSSWALVDHDNFCIYKSTNANTDESLNYCYDSSSTKVDCVDCYEFKCEDQTADHTDRSICLNTSALDGGYFDSPVEYCTVAIAASYTEFTLSDLISCVDGNGDSIDCGDSTACCEARCKIDNAAYLDSCDVTTFSFINLDTYCTNECGANDTYTLDDCTTGCVERDCQVLNCVSDITASATFSTICLSADVTVFFFESEKAYCDSIVDSTSTYTLGGQMDCSGSICVDEAACCSSRCMNETFFDSCDDSYNLIVQSAYCDSKCNNIITLTLTGCTSDGNQVDCVLNDCEFRKCQAANSDYDSKTICYETAGFNSQFYNNSAELCQARVDASNSDYTFAPILCGVDDCVDAEACCNRACSDNDSYVAICDPVTYNLLNLTDYCSANCSSVSYEPITCDTGPCDEQKCEYLQCVNDLGSVLTGTICLETTLADVYYFADLASYCDAKSHAGEFTYDSPTTISCAGSDCNNEEACYVAKCVEATAYVAKCDPSTYTVLTEQEYCSYIYSQGTGSDPITCSDASGDIACVDCEIFKCRDANAAYAFTTVCLNDVLGVSDFYSTLDEYCIAKAPSDAADYTLTESSYTTCNSLACANSGECCYDKCIIDAIPGCDTEDYHFVSIEEYCTTFCGDNSYTVNYCDSVCDETACAHKECVAAIVEDSTTVCLESVLGGDIFFDSKDLYCDAKLINANDGNYVIDYSIKCDTSACVDANACCNRNCNLDATYLDQCNTDSFAVVDQSTYCENSCNATALNLESCYNDDNLTLPVACVDCALIQCEHETAAALGGSSFDGYCANDDVYYATLRSYCSEYITAGVTISIQMCKDASDADIMCTSDDTCCYYNCLSDNSSYSPRCDSANFIWLETVGEFCTAYCPSRAYDAYLVTGGTDFASQDECCTQECISQHNFTTDVCSKDTFEVVTVDEQCAASCAGPIDYRSCDLDCTADDCKKHECLYSYLSSYGSAKVCGDDGVFYDTHDLFCDAKLSDDISIQLCSGSECADETACCNADCASNLVAITGGLCDSDLNLYANVNAFCTSSCNPTATLTVNMCDGSVCTESQCCNDKCLLTNTNDVCDSSIPDTPQNAEAYCSNYCDDSTYDVRVLKCAGDCAASDCQLYACVYDVSLVFNVDGENVCGNNGVFYNDVTEYCTAKLLNGAEDPTDYQLCASDSKCADTTSCCEASCYANVNVGFENRCTSDYVYYNDAAVYCSSTCNDLSLTDLTCDTNDDGICSQKECCLLECDNETYVGVCDSSYTYLDKAGYCDQYCPTKDSSSFKTCTDGDCVDQIECNTANCENALASYSGENLCLITKLNSLSFYSNLADYCNVQANSAAPDYTEANLVKCNDTYCVDDVACCKARCLLDANYKVACNPVDYSLLDHSQYCSYICDASNASNPVDECLSGADAADCTDCNIFKCLDENVAYDSVTLCTVAEYNFTYFFDDVTSYCNDAIIVDLATYALASADIACSDTDCGTQDNCCKNRCNNDPSRVAVCDSTYTLYSITTQCDDHCGAGEDTHYECTDDCVQEDCNYMKCLADNSTLADKSVCFSVDVNSYVTEFTADLATYCTALKSVTKDSYAVDSPILCGGSCALENDCCKDNCMSLDYMASCSEEYVLLDKDAYCTQVCLNSGIPPTVTSCEDDTGAAIDCTSCELLKCLNAINAPAEDPAFCIANSSYDSINFFDSYTAYCQQLVDNSSAYTLGALEVCGGSCATSEECCISNCMVIEDSGFCYSSDFSYVSKVDFCSAHCGDNTAEVIRCSGGCSGNDCKIQKCEDAFGTDINANVCVKDYNSGDYFGTLAALCGVYAAADNTDYQVADVVYCGDGTEVCTEEKYCLEAICLLATEIVRCDQTTIALVGRADYCNRYYINNETFDECSDANGITSCTDCSYFQCLFDVSSYSDASHICANDEIVYASAADFCTEKESNAGLTTHQCSSGNVCTTDMGCCIDICKESYVGDYVPQCNNSTFVYDADLDTYCTTACNLAGAYTTYEIETVVATDQECCTARCELENNYDTLCDPDTYAVVIEAGQCSDKCADPSKQFISCDLDPCTEDLCQVKQCENVYLGSYISSHVCGDNGTYYDTKAAFCADRIVNNIAIQLCGSDECNSDILCCEADCEANFASHVGKLCDADWTVYDDAATFCAASCTSGALVAQVCGADYCDETSCCTYPCVENNPYAVCNITSAELLSSVDYCDQYCADNNIQTNVQSCNSADCTVDVCQNITCNHNIGLIFASGDNVCGNNGVLYSNVADFCTAELGSDSNKPTDYLLCDGAVCGLLADCCKATCVANNADFSNRCTSDFVWYTTVADYCEALCTNANLTDLANCGASADTLCDQTECCEQDCNAATTGGRCADDFTYMSQSEYCTAYCLDTSVLFKKCNDVDCNDQTDCDKEHCAESLVSYADKAVCLTDLVGGEYFYETLDAYCSALIITASPDFSISNLTSCNNDFCIDSQACCAARCEQTGGYIATCNPTTYETFTLSDYCAYICDSANDSTPPDQCYSDADQADCSDCNIFKCLAQNDSFASGSICVTDLVETSYYFNNVNEYCAVIIATVATDYTIAQDAVACSANTCGSKTECCDYRCNNDATRFDTCNDSYELYTVVNQCSDLCGAGESHHNDCSGNCTQDDCNYNKCLNDNIAHTGSVCISSLIGADFYFADNDTYCIARDSVLEDNYIIADELTCDGCNEDDCCSMRCQQNYIAVCDQDSYVVLSAKEYCDSLCGVTSSINIDQCATDGTQVDCVDCNIFKCQDDYAAKAEAQLCLDTPLHGVKFFANADDYCTLLIKNLDSSYVVGDTVKCDSDSVCLDENSCCQAKCLLTAVEVCLPDFTHKSAVEVCEAQCSGSPFAVTEDCNGAGCSADECAIRKCQDDWGIYTDSVCLVNGTNYYFATVRTYCEDNSLSGVYVTSNPAYCDSDACNSGDNCCSQKCLDTNNLDMCNSSTYDLLTSADYCGGVCADSPADTISCKDSGDITISCTANICADLACLDAFASYSYASICLTEAFSTQYYFATFEQYCQDKADIPETVISIPSNLSCKNTNGDDIECIDDEHCCIARCLVDILYAGCDQNGNLVSANDICINQCNAADLTITYCGTSDCVSCINQACFSQNTDYTSSHICLTTEYANEYFYNSLTDYCAKKTENGDTDYNIASAYFECTDGDCNDKIECCNDICLTEAFIDSCDPTSFDLVTEVIHCSDYCDEQTIPDYLNCHDTNGVSACTQDQCNIEYKCPDLFASYPFTSVCISGDTIPTYYAAITDYCNVNGAGATEVPTYLTCKDGADADIDCVDEASCCYAQCIGLQTKTGCDASYNLVTPNNFCTSKCAGDAEILLSFCNGESCDSCEELKCEGMLNQNYGLSTVCLVASLESEIFYNSIANYCAAYIGAGGSDYTLAEAAYVTCTGIACASHAECCPVSCDANDYKATCDSNFNLYTKADNCIDVCGSTVVITHSCGDVGSEVDCTDDDCCVQKIVDANGDIAICGNNGTLYATALLYCNAKSNDSSIDLYDCNGECTAKSCFVNNCANTNDITAIEFPRCGDSSNLYADKSSYCDAYFDNNAIVLIDTCDNLTCNEEVCCDYLCTGSLEAVLYIIDGSLAGYDNACLANCANVTTIYNCDAGVSVADCISSYDLTCGGVCSDYINSTNSYCTSEDGYLTAAIYCSLYICDTGAKYNQLVTTIVGCEGNNCSESECTLNTCLNADACAAENVVPICGADGNSYEKECEAICYGSTKVNDCANTINVDDATELAAGLAICQYDCNLARCVALNQADAVEPVCASNRAVYDKASVVTCLGLEESFACEKDCKGAVRELRCKFDCLFTP